MIRCPVCKEPNAYDEELVVCHGKDLVYNALWIHEMQQRVFAEILAETGEELKWPI